MTGKVQLQMGQLISENPELKELAEGAQVKLFHQGCEAGPCTATPCLVGLHLGTLIREAG